MKLDILRLAVSKSLRSLARKLPVVVFAALACYGLYYLDFIKRSFDGAKTQPIFVDEEVRNKVGEKVKEKDGGQAVWENIARNLPLRQYTTEGDFVNRVVAQISRSAEAKDYVARADLNTCVSKALTLSKDDATPFAQTSGASAKQLVKANHASPSDKGEQANELTINTPVDPSANASAQQSSLEQCSADYISADLKSYSETQNSIANVYRYLDKIELKKIREEIDKAKQKPAERSAVAAKGYVEASLQPILEEKSGLYVIYQILRIACIVTIVFTLITVIGLLLRALLLTEGVKAFAAEASSLVGGARNAVVPGAAKAAMVSVAALGVGTAVVAGVALNNNAYQPLGQYKNAFVDGDGRGKPERPREPSRRPRVTNYDLTDAQYAYVNNESLYDFTQDNRSTSNSVPVPTPIVRVYPRIVIPGDFNSGPAQIDPSMVAEMKRYFTGQTQLNDQLSQKITSIASPKSSDDIRVANQLQTDKKDKPLLVDLFDSQYLTDPINALNTSIKTMESLNTALTEHKMNDLELPARPKERSTVKRWFVGSDRYFVSKRAEQQLTQLTADKNAAIQEQISKLNSPTLSVSGSKGRIEAFEKQVKVNKAISSTLHSLYLKGGKALDRKSMMRAIKEAFLEALKSLKVPVNSQDEASILLDPWSDTILTYTRIP